MSELIAENEMKGNITMCGTDPFTGTVIAVGSVYTVPNVVVVAVGGDINMLVENAALNFANQTISQAQSEGFETVFMWYGNQKFNTQDLKSKMTSDTWGLAMYGHGVVPKGYFAIDKIWDFKASDMPSHKVGFVVAKMCSSYYHDWDKRVVDSSNAYVGGLAPISYMPFGVLAHPIFVKDHIKDK